MQRYFVGCTHPDGSSSVERVYAPDADSALEMTRGMGHSNVQLLADDVVVMDSKRADVEKVLTPQEELNFRLRGRWYPARVVLSKTPKVLIIFPLLILIYQLATQGAPGLPGFVALGILSLPVIFGVQASLASEPHRRMMRAFAQGQWSRALELLEQMEKSPKLSKLLPPSELGFRRAQALAGMGKRSEALSAAENACADDTQPAWTLQLRMAHIFLIMKDTAAAERCHQRAVELAPESSFTHLAYAEFKAGHSRRDPAGARESLDAARNHAIALTHRWAELKIEGLIAFEEGSYESAYDKLETARSELRLQQQTEITALADAYMAAYSCLALSALGAREEAAGLFQRIDPLLRPHGLEDLLDRCRNAIA